MQFRVLGPIELAAGGRTRSLSSARRRFLLARLLVSVGSVVPADRLVEAVWGGQPPASARETLQSHVSRLRSMIREMDGAGERIMTRPGGYALELADGDEVDAAVFERETARARQLLDGRPGEALDLLDRALGRWRGPPYGDATEAVAEEVRRLELERRRAQGLRIEALLRSGRHETAVVELEGRLEEEPFDERLAGQLMAALFRSGRQAQAVESFHAFRERLVDEFGVDPSPELVGRYQALLRQDEEIVAAPVHRAPPDPDPPPTGTDEPAGSPWEPTRSPTSLVGRGAALAEVAGLLDSRALVTLTGPGGVGKTRLARAVAERVRDDHDDVAVIELGSIREPASLGQAVAGSLGIVPGDGPVRGRLVSALQGRPVLLLIDNCEHLLPEVAELVEHLVRHCPTLTVLATSREPLAADGEHRWPVPPLDLPPGGTREAAALAANPAVQLFCDRARAADPGFTLSDDNAAAVADVCRSLDGLPLALELAAARVAAFPVEDLAARLDERFRLLTAGPHHEQGRHRTLREVVGWSHDLLTGAEARLFERLSVFVGGFTLEAAEQVAGGNEVDRAEVAGDLALLVDKSMVARSGPRYRLLETLRLYGREQLDERGGTAQLRGRHARFCAELAAQAGPAVKGPDERAWVERLGRELDNLRAAHRWAVEVGDADVALRLSAPLAMYADWWLIDEVSRWAEQAVSLPGADGHRLQPVAYGLAARGAGNRGELDRCVSLARRGLGATPEGDPRRIVALKALSLEAFYQGRLGESSGYEAQILELAEAAGDDYHLAYVWVMRALIATYQGEQDAARAAAERAGAAAGELGNRHLGAVAAYCRGEAIARTDPQTALGWLAEAITVARDLGVRLVEAIALVTRSSIQARQGEPEAALHSFREAITRLRRGGDWTHQWTTVRNLVFLLARLGADEAAALLVGAIETTGTAAEVYGADAARLQATTTQLRERLGESDFEEARDRGRRMSDPDAVQAALSIIDRHVAPPSET